MDDLKSQLLDAWRVNNAIHLRLLDGIPAKGLRAVPAGSRGRNVAQQFVHLHKVRAGWLRYNGHQARLKRFPKGASPSRAQLQAAFRASGKAVEQYLAQRLDGGSVRFFKRRPARWLAYMIAHESHHRGQIALALKQAGLRLPEKVALGVLWYKWYFGEP
jgi:uncharacterized damage-inducible protein DinB